MAPASRRSPAQTLALHFIDTVGIEVSILGKKDEDEYSTLYPMKYCTEGNRTRGEQACKEKHLTLWQN